MFVASVSAVTYTFGNSTDVDTISQMVSGEAPIKNNKFIKDGDIVKFKSGNYNNLNLVIKKSIKITKSNKKSIVIFSGNNTGTAIKLANKKKKVNINGIKIENYGFGIQGKTNSAKISKMTFYKNSNRGISIQGSKLTISSNKFVGNEESIYIHGKNNIISHNKINKGGSYSSLIFVRGSNNLIRYNKIKAPESYAISVGGNKNKISKNTVNKCLVGINVGGNRNLISYNKLFNMGSSYGGSGISIEGKYITVKYNVVKYSTCGLVIWGVNNTASYNKLHENKVGIEYFKGNKLLKNKFTNNKKNTKLEDKNKYRLDY